jgi:hypothetical protein
MGPLLPTSHSTTTVIETLDYSRSPMLVGIRSREFAASTNFDEVYPLLPLAKVKRVQPSMPPLGLISPPVSGSIRPTHYNNLIKPLEFLFFSIGDPWLGLYNPPTTGPLHSGACREAQRMPSVSEVTGRCMLPPPSPNLCCYGMRPSATRHAR